MFFFVIIILTSVNEKLLKITYNSIIEQKNHNLNYNIIINVNSLNKDYYNDVLKEFENIDVEIIKTISNGKPGMGHNSCIDLFKNHKKYDYMILVDGDDFLYPYAFSQLEKCFMKYNNLDMLMLKSTDKLKVISENNNDIFDINLNNNFIISSKTYVSHKLYPWNIEHIKLSNFYNNSLCTPFRLFLLHRNIFKHISNNLYHNECELYDDYLTFLYFVRLSNNKNLNCFIIPGKYIYLYNNINHNSQTNNSSNNDLIYYEKLKSEFLDVYNFLGVDWNITKLNTLYISHHYDIKQSYDINENNYTININTNLFDLYYNKNYIYIQNFGNHILNQIIQSYFDNSIKFFNLNDYNKLLSFTTFFITYNIKNPIMHFMYIYSLFHIFNTNISNIYINNMKNSYTISKCIFDFYNISYLNQYIQFILLL